MAKDGKGELPTEAREGDLTRSDSGRSAEDAGYVRGYMLALRGGWRPRVRSEKTYSVYEFAVRRFLAWMREKNMPAPRHCTREHVLEYVAELRSAHAAATVQLYLAAVRSFFDWMREEGERRDVPTERIRPPDGGHRVVQPYSQEEVERILASQNTDTLMGARNAALFLALLDTSLRRSELVQMRVDAIDWDHGLVTVIGKGDKQRAVRLSPTARRAVDRYLRLRRRAGSTAGAESPWLWLDRSGERLTAEAVTRLHADLGKALGFHVHPHRWRHTAIQSMLDDGMDRESVRQISGHGSFESLRRYTETGDARRALEAHRAHSPVERLVKRRKG